MEPPNMMQEYFPSFPHCAVARLLSLLRSAFAISARYSRLLHPTRGLQIPIFQELPSRNPSEAPPELYIFSSLLYLLVPPFVNKNSPLVGVSGQMEMEELADKSEVTVDVLGKNPSLRSNQRFPRDEAVLARFGKKQQFRVSSPLQLSSFQLHSQARHQYFNGFSSLIRDVVCSGALVSYL